MNALTPMLTIADIVARTEHDTDFFADFWTVGDHPVSTWGLADKCRAIAERSLNQAVEDWQFDHRKPQADLTPQQRATAIATLVEHAWAEMSRRAECDAVELSEAIASGDYDRQGNFIPYDNNWGV